MAQRSFLEGRIDFAAILKAADKAPETAKDFVVLCDKYLRLSKSVEDAKLSHTLGAARAKMRELEKLGGTKICDADVNLSEMGVVIDIIDYEACRLQEANAAAATI